MHKLSIFPILFSVIIFIPGCSGTKTETDVSSPEDPSKTPVISSPPAPAAPAEDEDQTLYYGITKDVLREDGTAEIYAAPDMESEIISIIPDGKQLKLLHTIPYGWYEVQLEDGTKGYADSRTIYTQSIPPHEYSPETEDGYTLVFTHSDQRLRVYYDGKQLLSALGSSGTADLYTPRGVLLLEENRRGEWWYSEKHEMGLKYWVGFKGIWLFHSIPYTREGEIIEEEAEKLGSPASHGCIRLPPETAKYIHDMIPPGSLVLIY